jgi:hypothetical protein
LQPDYTLETIKDKNHEDIMLVLEELKTLKDERRNTISDLLSQIYNIPREFIGIFDHDVPAVCESDLSQELLEEYQSLVEGLTKEKVIWLPLQYYQLVVGLKTAFDFIH